MVHCERQCILIMNCTDFEYRVAVLDDNNASAEGAFSVMVMNENEAPTTLGHSSVLSVLENQAAEPLEHCGIRWGFIDLPLGQWNEMEIIVCLPWI